MKYVAIFIVLLLSSAAYAQFGGVLGWQQSAMSQGRALDAEQRVLELQSQLDELRTRCK